MEQGHFCEVGIAFWFVGLVVSCCRGPAISAWPQAKTLSSVAPAKGCRPAISAWPQAKSLSSVSPAGGKQLIAYSMAPYCPE